ncbi:MAG: arylsulfatase [Eubacteriales bacterium]
MTKPNVVLMFVDDLGYGDVSCFNPESKIPTPHIDALAKNGMKFTDSHSVSALCTPSRYGLLTGRYPFRSDIKYTVITGDSMPLIEDDRMTLADLFKENGYKTSCVGKWHLGLRWQLNQNFREHAALGEQKLYDDVPQRVGDKATVVPLVSTWVESLDIDFTKPILNGPCEHGFDYFYGMAASLDTPPYLYIENNMAMTQPTRLSGCMHVDRATATMQQDWQCGPIAEGFDHVQVLDDMNDKVLELIDNYTENDEKFFIYYPTPAVHGPILPNKKFQGKSGINAYGDIVMQLDDMVGQITKKLSDKNILEDTIFIFTSDNGCSGVADLPFLESKGHFSSAIYKSHKMSLYEGGHRVPTIISCPNMIEKNTSCNKNICHTDFFATFAQLFSQELKDDVAEDSFSNLALWEGTGDCERTSSVYTCLTGHLGVVKDGWKLNCCENGCETKELILSTFKGEYCPQKFELYNLNVDPSEANNLIDNESEKVEELTVELIKVFDNGRSTKGEKQENNLCDNWHQINFK